MAFLMAFLMKKYQYDLKYVCRMFKKNLKCVIFKIWRWTCPTTIFSNLKKSLFSFKEKELKKMRNWSLAPDWAKEFRGFGDNIAIYLIGVDSGRYQKRKMNSKLTLNFYPRKFQWLPEKKLLISSKWTPYRFHHVVNRLLKECTIIEWFSYLINHQWQIIKSREFD